MNQFQGMPQDSKVIDKYIYNPKDQLGQGSFGTVYLGHSISNQSEIYAIKVIPVTLINSDPELQESLLNEMKVMKLLNHTNIIHCFDVLSSKNNHYFIMENCSGGTLAGHLKKKGRLSESEALNILIQILKGYYEMLKLGIIHRDLKPENILIQEGVFKLADFGFAKCVENFNKEILKTLVGTPLYMSPQILQHKDYTTKTDLWSIALIYYEMLFGKTPWNAKSQYELTNKILSQPVGFPNDIRISDESARFIMGALKVDESQRFTWDQVFSHKLFNDCFDYNRKKNELKDQAISVQSKLKTTIVERDIDLFKLFTLIDKNHNNVLEMEEFAEFIKLLDKNMTREQVEYVYNSIDEDNCGSITLYEFRAWLADANPNQANKLRTTSVPVRNIPPQTNQTYTYNQPQNYKYEQAKIVPNQQYSYPILNNNSVPLMNQPPPLIPPKPQGYPDYQQFPPTMMPPVYPPPQQFPYNNNFGQPPYYPPPLIPQSMPLQYPPQQMPAPVQLNYSTPPIIMQNPFPEFGHHHDHHHHDGGFGFGFGFGGSHHDHHHHHH